MALHETEDLPACLNKNISHPHLSLFLCPLPLAEKKYVTCFPAWIYFPFPITNTVHALGFLWVSDCYTHSNTLKFLPGFGGSQHKQRSSPLPLRWRTEVWEALLSLPRERIPKGKKICSWLWGMQYLKEKTWTEFTTYTGHLTWERNSFKIFVAK